MSEQLQKTSPDTAASGESYFDGTTLQFIGYKILALLLCAVTLGLAFPWTLCMIQGWEARHTVIRGRRLKFDGSGGQLFGRYLLWVLLTVVTLGIYGLFLGLSVKKWTVKHTSYADGARSWESYFSGGAGGYLGVHILALLLTVFTLGIGAPWAKTMLLRWEAGHTHIGGGSLSFDGSGGQLLGKCLLLAVLTPLTLGIYALCFPVSYTKWLIRHTGAPGRPAPDQESPAAPDRAGPPESAPASGGSRAVPVLLCVAGAAALFFLGPVLLPRARQAANLVPNLYYRLHAPRQVQSQPIQRTLTQGLKLGDKPASPEAAPEAVPSPEAPPEAVYDVDYTQSIVGKWKWFELSYPNEVDAELLCTGLVFSPDGTFYDYGIVFHGRHKESMPSGYPTEYDFDEWVSGAGVEAEGTYRLEGDKLIITIIDAGWMLGMSNPRIEDYTVNIKIEGDTLSIHDEEGRYPSELKPEFIRDGASEPAPAAPQPEAPSESPYAQSIIGEWVSYELDPEDNTLVISYNQFDSDGTFGSCSSRCISEDSDFDLGLTSEDFRQFGTYYDGRYWCEAASYSSGGTYRLEGDMLIMDTIAYGDELGESTSIIRIEGDTLTFYDEYGYYLYQATRSN